MYLCTVLYCSITTVYYSTVNRALVALMLVITKGDGSGGHYGPGIENCPSSCCWSGGGKAWNASAGHGLHGKKGSEYGVDSGADDGDHEAEVRIAIAAGTTPYSAPR